MPATPHDPPPVQRPLREAVAWSELARPMLVVATGRDAVAFVDRFTTASLAAIAVGHGTETVFCDARGHVLALALVLRTADGLEIDAGRSARVSLLDHLEHHHIREQLELRDASLEHVTFLVAGPTAANWLAERLGVAVPHVGDHVTSAVGSTAVQVIRTGRFGPAAFLLRVAADDAAAVRQWLSDTGLSRADADAVETVRIEERTPEAADLPEKTLPQELELPPGAISFTKGCYLGQETVARLDALGHVNRVLSVVACDGGTPPAAGAILLADGAPVGTITSSCPAPSGAASLGLALVHRRAAEPTARLTIEGRRAWLEAARTASGGRG
ncbi:MAG: YgfZ/GcvT domain-containing protein [Planctomycetaceae bacterium]